MSFKTTLCVFCERLLTALSVNYERQLCDKSAQSGINDWEIKLSHLVHVGLYLLMLAIPVSGWLHDSAWKDAATHPLLLFYEVPWPRIGLIEHMNPVAKEVLHTVFGAVHEWLGIALVMLFLLHIAAVIKHSWIDHESVLNRMLP
jgi:cytochrome b561